MKISEIIAKIEAYHPDLGPDYQGCDGIKAGNPDVECTGIVSALVPTMDVVSRTAKLGCNLLYVHEPTSYISPDVPGWPVAFPCHVYEEKIKLAEKNGIVIYRDHDHAHAHRPDSIFTGVIKYLGWEKYEKKDEQIVPFGYLFEFPEPRTVNQLNREFLEKIGMNGIRYIGREDAQIRRVALVGHIYPGAFVQESFENGVYNDYSTEIIRIMEQNNVDCVLPGEVIEWNLLSYIRDAAAMGENKVCINIGHFNWEQLGAKYAADWISELVGKEIPVTYMPTGDIWKYQLR